MELIDRVLTCLACGAPFTWTVREQAGYGPAGVERPVVCRGCRSARRLSRQSLVVDRTRVLGWLQDEGLVPAIVSGLQADARDRRSWVSLRAREDSRSLRLPLSPLEALVVAIWLEPEPADCDALGWQPAERPSFPRALAVLLEPVLPIWPEVRPIGYRLVLLMPGAPQLRRLGTTAALGWVLQDHTPLLVDARLFPLGQDGHSWPPRPGSALHRLLSELEGLDDL